MSKDLVMEIGREDKLRRLPDGFLAPPDRQRPPKHRLPAGATDCHAHVFGPFDRYKLAAERHYSPAELPGERYLRMLDEVGLARGVLVQGGAHGTDCGAMLAALDLAPERLRGVVAVTPDVCDEMLADMNRRGVRGARFSLPPGGLGKGAVGFEALAPLAPRLAALGWHAQVQAPAATLMEALPDLLGHGLPIVIDHMALIDPDAGVGGSCMEALLEALESGRVWVKLTPYRLSTQAPGYEDVAPIHKAMVAACPERMLWGSDWPHVHMKADMPIVGALLNVFDVWVDDADLQQRILVDNPARLYGFGA
jgi:predicted TIM-barrel fold metal-dependent hydrolase